MLKRILILSVYSLILVATTSGAETTTSRPDGHAPIGVMRDHVHKQGEWMLSYRFGYMHMAGNRSGDSQVSTKTVLRDYMVAPTEMQMLMHMFGVMYGVTDQLTVAVMSGFADKEMNHTRRNNTTFILENDGVTDTQINALYQFYDDGTNKLQFNAGLSLPTGATDDTAPNGGIFAYPMRLGSGTYDLLPGINYRGRCNDWSWGGQVNFNLPIGRNNRGYSLGNRYQLTGWGTRQLNDMFSVSLRLDGQIWENIDGRDRALLGPTFIAPTLDPTLQAGRRIDLLAGINFIVPSGTLKGNRLAAEFGRRLYEYLDGPRLEADYHFTIGWQYAF